LSGNAAHPAFLARDLSQRKTVGRGKQPTAENQFATGVISQAALATSALTYIAGSVFAPLNGYPTGNLSQEFVLSYSIIGICSMLLFLGIICFVGGLFALSQVDLWLGYFFVFLTAIVGTIAFYDSSTMKQVIHD
jgi:hypothetical protein